MFVIEFGKWSRKSTKNFIHKRIYIKLVTIADNDLLSVKFIKTPFCKITKR